MNYLELYRSAYITYICLYHQKSWVSLTKKRVGRHLQLYWFVYITVSPWYRLQRRGFMNYLELYRSAYITYICLYHQKSWVSLTKKRVGRHLQLYWLVYITVSPWYRLQRRGFINYLFINLPISPKVLGVAKKKWDWTPFTTLFICTHHQSPLVSPTKKGIYEQFRAL